MKVLYDNKERLASVSVGMLVANLVASLLIDQFTVQIHPNVVVSGSLLLAAIINVLVGKYFRSKEGE